MLTILQTKLIYLSQTCRGSSLERSWGSSLERSRGSPLECADATGKDAAVLFTITIFARNINILKFKPVL
jgi:hypothetical protein